ncbi:MAG: twin-arginine translocase TatA/TatE family subunit [Chloroflexi bacterium]|nr:twin-arginine translocase TatA/TatE family subunit [Chloroflexota bacterium]
MVGIGMPGQWELMVVALVALLIFGRKLPKMARGIGASISEFKKGLHESREALDALGDQDDGIA